MDHIYPQVWVSLPKETREHLIKVFKLVRTGISVVKDQTLVSDGYTEEDLEGISLEKMCEYIGSQETFMRACELTLGKVHSELHPPVGEITGTKIVPGEVLIVEDKEEVPFCDTCNAKELPHKKYCPKHEN